MRNRGTDDGIVEISHRSNFLRKRERKKGRYEFCGGQKEWKNSLLMVSKVVSVRSEVLDLWCVYRVLEEKKKKR